MGKAVRVEQGCRDCKKCTNSGAANLGRNSGRTSMALATGGLSEVGMRAFAKKCRICNHQLSLHKGAEATTPQPGVSLTQMAASFIAAASAPKTPEPAAPPVASGPPAGFYPDPQGLAPYRWWNGQEWTEHTTTTPPQQ